MFSRRLATGLLLAFCLPLSARAAVTILDNGAPNLISGYDLTFLKEANHLTLSADVVAKSLKFWTLEPDTTQWFGLVYWEIRANTAANVPGTVLFSGNSTNLTHVATGRNASPYPEYLVTFDLPSAVSLLAGKYWLVLHNGPLSHNSSNNPADVMWETTTKNTSDPAYRASFGDFTPFINDWQSNDDVPPSGGGGSELAFQLIGTVKPNVTAFGFVSAAPRVSFTTVTGQNYKVEYKNNLTDTLWTTVSGASNVAGTGGVVQIGDPDPAVANGTIKHRFYRATVL